MFYNKRACAKGRTVLARVLFGRRSTPGNYLAILEGEAIIALWPVMHPIASKWCGKVQ